MKFPGGIKGGCYDRSLTTQSVVQGPASRESPGSLWERQRICILTRSSQDPPAWPSTGLICSEARLHSPLVKVWLVVPLGSGKGVWEVGGALSLASQSTTWAPTAVLCFKEGSFCPDSLSLPLSSILFQPHLLHEAFPAAPAPQPTSGLLSPCTRFSRVPTSLKVSFNCLNLYLLHLKEKFSGKSCLNYIL